MYTVYFLYIMYSIIIYIYIYINIFYSVKSPWPMAISSWPPGQNQSQDGPQDPREIPRHGTACRQGQSGDVTRGV